MKSLNFEQQIFLFKKAFVVYYIELNKSKNEIRWLSTHGKGVSWIHIRIDYTSKYIELENYLLF